MPITRILWASDGSKEFRDALRLAEIVVNQFGLSGALRPFAEVKIGGLARKHEKFRMVRTFRAGERCSR
jgi:hypothetical protein